MQLHRLVKTVEDEDTFNDAFLKLTYCYNPEEDFIKQYTYQFNLLKGKYHRYDRTLNQCQVPDGITEEDEEPVKMNDKQLLKRIIDYAILEKAKARKEATDKQGKQVPDLSIQQMEETEVSQTDGAATM